MSKRQYDHMENKIREAAENSEPAFEEQAWDKMEAKLNAEKDKRRSPFVWFSLALVAMSLWGGAAFFYNQSAKKLTEASNSTTAEQHDRIPAAATITSVATDNKSQLLSATDNRKESNKDQSYTTILAVQNNSNKKPGTLSINGDAATIVTTKNSRSISIAIEQKNIASNSNSDVVGNNNLVNANTRNTNNKLSTANISSTSIATTAVVAKKYKEKNGTTGSDNFTESNKSITYATSQKNKGNINGKTKTKIKAAAQVDEIADSSEMADDTATNNSGNKKVFVTIEKEKKKDSLQKIVPKDTVALKSSKDTTVKKEIKPKKNNWYLLASVGADISNVTLFSFNNSAVTARFGAGIGYQINKRFSVQTGFYAGRKKYVAGPGDYHSKDDAYLNNVNITKVSANCLIFEIPITVRYNFLLRPKTTYYATAGLSSFIMSNEAYDYYFNAYNTNYEVSHTYTGNKNLFSIAAFSVGVERKISKAFSIQAEPSINIPISGVGEGTVKLYSVDLQVGVKYNFHW